MKIVLAVMAMVVAAGPAWADGRSDWTGYDWQSTPFGICLPDVQGPACHFHHAKWDWKRNQWVDLFYIDASGGIEIGQQLTNRDRSDSDFVCVTVLFLDAVQRNVAAFHTNTEIGPEATLSSRAMVPLSAAQKSAIARVDVGTKQCREGAGQDDAVYAAVRSALAN